MSTVGDAPQWLNPDEMRFWRSFIVTANVLEARLNRELLESHGVSHSDYSILVVLSEAPDQQLRMSVLAEIVASSKSRLSHQVARMEKAGLVERRSCGDDGRGVLAVMCPAGRALLREAAPTHVRGVREHVISQLSTEEQRRFAAALERVLDGLSVDDTQPSAS